MITSSKQFHLVEEAFANAIRSGAARADAKGHDLDVAGVLWAAHLKRIHGGEKRADAASVARQSLASQLAASAFRGPNGMTVRADSTHFFADDLVDRDQRVTIRPQRPNALLGGIPIDPVQPWAESWTAKSGEDSGVAVPWRKGSADTQVVDYSVNEELRPMMMFRADVVENVGDAEQNALASHDFGSQAEQTRRALEAHAKAHNTGLLSGVAGFAGYHLGNIPGVLRQVSATIYGSATANDALSEFKAVIDEIPEKGDGAYVAPDTMLVTQRMLNRVGSYVAFVNGGTEFSDRMVRDLLSSKGITNIVIANELKNFGGANKDGMVLFNASDADSLKQKMGLRPAPVKTFDNGPALARQTAFLSGFGGLYARKGGSVLIYTAGVTA